jgi:fumarate reductase flavoprotein subunit
MKESKNFTPKFAGEHGGKEKYRTPENKNQGASFFSSAFLRRFLQNFSFEKVTAEKSSFAGPRPKNCRSFGIGPQVRTNRVLQEALRLNPFLAVILAGFLFAACSGEADAGNTGGTESASNTGVYVPGTYEGSGEGYEGTIKVSVTVNENKIIRIEVVEHTETPGFSTAAFEGLIEEILDVNSAEVDALSGASETSAGFLDAVEKALEKARP